MSLLLAALPILLVVLALALRQSVTRAALLGLLAANVIAVGRFGLDAAGARTALDQWWLPVLEVVAIIGGGIAFAEAGRRTGGQEVVATWLRENLGVGVPAVLAIVHGATPLAESLTGFGIGLAIGVPLLVGLGLPSRTAAITGLLGLCAVPWGSMGPGTLVAAQLGGVGFDELGAQGAALSLPVLLGTGIAAALLVARPGGRRGAIAQACLSALVLWGAIWAANVLVGTAPAGALGASAVLLGAVSVRRVRGGPLRAVPGLGGALVPYAVLLGGVLAAVILLRRTGLAETGWRHLASPALWLALASAVALRSHRAHRLPTLRAAGRSWLPVGPATGLFIVLGAVLAVSGMSERLAAALARLGAAYPRLGPGAGGDRRVPDRVQYGGQRDVRGTPGGHRDRTGGAGADRARAAERGRLPADDGLPRAPGAGPVPVLGSAAARPGAAHGAGG